MTMIMAQTADPNRSYLFKKKKITVSHCCVPGRSERQALASSPPFVFCAFSMLSGLHPHPQGEPPLWVDG